MYIEAFYTNAILCVWKEQSLFFETKKSWMSSWIKNFQ